MKGTAQYENSVKDRGRLQSYLIISENDTQELIKKYAGTEIVQELTNGKPQAKEYVSVDKVIGYYYKDGVEYPTKRVEIVYAKDGTHVFPVKWREDD